MTDDLRAQTPMDRPTPPPATDLSTADLAAAAERSAGASTTDLKRNIDDREVERTRKAGAPRADANAPSAPRMRYAAARRRRIRLAHRDLT